MPFPVTYVIEQLAPSETFIRRELDLLRRRNWPIFTRLLTGGKGPLAFALRNCPEGFRWRFAKAACARVGEELFRSPLTAARIAKRLPQAASLAQKIVETESRLIHAQFAGVTADLAGIAARTLGLPWTCAVHAHDVFTAPPRVLCRRLRTARGIVACSQRAADAVTRCGIPPDRVTVIYHSLSLNDFPYDTIQPDGVLLCAGRLEPKKGVDTLLAACAILRQRNTPFTCVIVGTGSAEPALRRLVDKLDLGQSVVFVGWQSQEETRSYLIDASVLALPSRRTPDGDSDGIANILVEALALGTPIVTTTAASAPEVIVDTVSGLLVPPDDPERLADALVRALGSKELCIRLSREGRKVAETHFDGSRNIPQLEAFFARTVTPSA